MKIKKLKIHSYKHLPGLYFDFTYPEGHEKFGQPLEKICLIGQSATGKTSILEAIKNNFVSLFLAEIISERFLFKYNHDLDVEFEYLADGIIIMATKFFVSVGGRKYETLNSSGSGTVTKIFQDNLRLIYLSSDLVIKETVNLFNKNPLNILEETKTNGNTNEWHNTESHYIYEFIEDLNADFWFSLLYEILDYRKRFTQMASEVINKGSLADVNRLSRKFAEWSLENRNPLQAFADAFNPILNNLKLEIDSINTEYPIPIKSKQRDDVIPISGLSTGTKELLLSMFPLYKLDTEDAIILIDEPERSLFPDMQIELISHYKKLAPNAQLIVATHSPFIAAAFEPEERFILYFDESGKVAFRRGEAPIGDDPNDILKNDFNVDYFNEFGKTAYKNYLDLKAKVAGEKDPEKKKELVIELAELGDKYNF